MDGILHNTSQDDTYDAVARDVVTGAVDGYNGEVQLRELLVLKYL